MHLFLNQYHHIYSSILFLIFKIRNMQNLNDTQTNPKKKWVVTYIKDGFNRVGRSCGGS